VELNVRFRGGSEVFRAVPDVQPMMEVRIMKHRFLTSVAAALLLAGSAFAQQGDLPPIPDDAPIYGSQIMTPEERVEHRIKMRSAKTLEEREQIRSEHHKQMVERARERGVTLPDEPPMRGGMGPGGGGR
jgi:hypothetical protein